jgi:hypothetical protein
MIYEQYRLAIPSNKEYSIPQLKMMIQEIEMITGERIPLKFWNEL